MEKAIIIARCSTTESRQDVTRQSFDLTNKYSKQYDIVEAVEYYKSGRSNDEQLEQILQLAIEKGAEHLIFTEISRIARRVIEILVFVRTASNQGINIIIDNYNMHTLNRDKSQNSMTMTMFQIGSSFAELELKQTHQRLNSGRAKYIASGGKLGRKVNTKESPEQLLIKHKDILKFLKQGQSTRNIMALTNKSSGTVQKIRKLAAAA